MSTRAISNQISFRYRTTDSATGITRETARRIAEQLGVAETQAIHIALHELAVKLLPQYEADGGPGPPPERLSGVIFRTTSTHDPSHDQHSFSPCSTMTRRNST
ncbi:hypothetical protein RBA41_03805 [Massilia sp. CCM 9210]|uniref:hypothetical protein n=1 Tax=Massilia scottii TaxID=3057166 RepID=UPI002796CFB9|nr:hypothetical protein [Massilia sp. CCM 9210]MDQ1812421.1 hypothetical protein [Massilia sp. CCM 9210]